LAVAASFGSTSKFGGPVHPDFSNKVIAYRIGTAKFEAVFSVKIAKVIPITRPMAQTVGRPTHPRRSARRKQFAVL